MAGHTRPDDSSGEKHPGEKHLIVGTAGHVDHGKTTLIKAITGTDTDRLREEQERGLTIDLGFASFKLPGGQLLGIVDVPGHEKFLKNMLAGASGVDIALMVVAADEGVMPQTSEHLEILELLETKHGVVALTKCDMVEEEWLEAVEEDLQTSLQNTFLKDARIVRVSGTTGQGVDDLIAELQRLADDVEQRSGKGPFRLPIDRVFTMTGFGTVVTGTLVSGTIQLGDAAHVLPQKLNTRIRQIQVHGKKQDRAEAGTRAAVNLAGIDVDQIERGSVLVPPGYLHPTNTLDAYIEVLKESPWPLKNRTRVRVHIGTAEAIGRTTIIGGSEISPGESGFVQLKLEKDVVAARGDRFVIRLYSPMRVIGGGKVLDPAGKKHKRGDTDIISRLERKLKGDPTDILEDVLALNEMGLATNDLAAKAGLSGDEIDSALDLLEKEGLIVKAGARVFHTASYQSLVDRLTSALGSYHRTNPMRSAMPREELRRHLGRNVDQKGFQAVVQSMEADGTIAAFENGIKLAGHQPILDEKQQKAMDAIEAEYREAGASPPFASEIERRLGHDSQALITLLLESGRLVNVTTDIHFHSAALQDSETRLRAYLESHGQMTVAQFRDLVGSSRKYVVPLLEYFDKKRVTRRTGDVRKLAT